MTRTTVRLPDDLLERAKAHASGTGRTFTQLIEQAIRSELARQPIAARVGERHPTYVAPPGDGSGVSEVGETVAGTSPARERLANQLLEQVKELQAFLGALPDLDTRSADEILGYDASGLPR